jgi:hypothetical protein
MASDHTNPDHAATPLRLDVDADNRPPVPLRPCPFCGGAAVYRMELTRRGALRSIHCADCKLASVIGHDDAPLEAWNRRAPAPQAAKGFAGQSNPPPHQQGHTAEHTAAKERCAALLSTIIGKPDGWVALPMHIAVMASIAAKGMACLMSERGDREAAAGYGDIAQHIDRVTGPSAPAPAPRGTP